MGWDERVVVEDGVRWWWGRGCGEEGCDGLSVYLKIFLTTLYDLHL